MKRIYLSTGIGIGIFLIAFTLFSVTNTRANPSLFQPVVPLTTATSTLVYLSPGLATTTYVWDTGIGTAQAIDHGVILVHFVGSTTLPAFGAATTTYKISFEYTHNNPNFDCSANQNACDWYTTDLSQQATTTPNVNLSTDTSITIQLSTTTATIGGIAPTASSTSNKMIRVSTPTRYVRAIFSIPAGSTNGGFTAQYIGKREVSF